MSPTGPGWGVVMPVKRLSAAKSRLSTRPIGQRRDLALAFALDVVAACRATTQVGAVVVVCDDDRVREAATALGADLVAEPSPDGLLAALLAGTAALHASHPDLAVALLAADLPALRPRELARALDAAAAHPRAFVSDVAGTGSTLLTAHAGIAPISASARAPGQRTPRRGRRMTDPRLVRLRCDVDTEVDLWHARALGVGPHTAAVLAQYG